MRTRRGSIVSTLSIAIAIFLLFTNLPVVLAQRNVVPTAAAVVVPVFLLLAVLHQVVIRRRGVVVDRTLWLMFAFLGVFLVSSFTVEGHEVALARIGVFLSEGIVVYFLVRNAIRDMPDLRVAMLVMLAAGCLLAGLTIVQAVTGMYDQDFMGLAQRSLEHLEDGGPVANANEMGLEDRSRGPVDDPNRYAQILLLAAPLAFVLMLNALRPRGTMGGAICLAVLLGGVLLTYSRGAFVTLIILIALSGPLRLVPPRRIVTTLVAGIVLTPIVIPGYAERVASIAGVADLIGKGQVEADGPTRGRTTEMLAAFAAYTDHPVVGVGPGQYMPYHSVYYQSLPEISIRELATPRRAHSLYFEIAAETGTLGLLIFMAMPFLLLRDLEAVRRDLTGLRPDLARVAAGFSLVVLGYLGTGVFLHLAYERYYWFILAVTSAAIAVLDRHARDSGPAVQIADTRGRTAWRGEHAAQPRGGVPC